MKKIYNKPELNVLILQASAHLMTGSNVSVGDEYDGSTPVLSRRSNFDDNEEDW